MFEKASRLKLRFETDKGLLTVEDLWNIPLTSTTGKVNLDDVARGLHAHLKNEINVSFVNPDKTADPVTNLKFDIVKHVIAVRLAEANAAALERSKKEKKQHLMEIIARKEDEALSGASLEELRAMINAL